MSANPYEPSLVRAELSEDVFDRTQRNDLAATIRRFLQEKLSAFEFDEALCPFRTSTDAVVRYVAEAVWFHYDDCTDHLVALTKPEWDYFQRLLLLLESNGSVEVTTIRCWSWTQLLAAGALFGFTEAVWHLGWGMHLLVLAMPFGLISLGISRVRRGTISSSPYDPIVFPFGSFGDLRQAYDSVGFKKDRYPRKMQPRRIRSPLMNAALQLQFYTLWLMLSPVVLSWQMFPAFETRVRALQKD